MKKHILVILLALVGITAQAQAPAGYYNSANGKTGEELRQALHEIISNHTSISYDAIWDAFYNTDHRTDQTDKVWDIYSDIPGGTPKLFTLGDGQCGNYAQEGDCYNREHSWPKSWFDNNENSTPGRDLHHIFPTDGYVNAQRSNYPYGEVQTASYTSHNGSKLGSCKSSLGYNGTVFEPIDEYKGDIARAYFYMSTRYYGEDSGWGSSGMTEGADLKPWAITMLLDWNANDPVSQKEIDRNNVIYNNYQHNRNPFIDNPDYAHMIWDPNWTPSTPTGGDYVKVTSTEELEDGDYLIVCENNNVAFNGALTTLDAVSNTINVSISNSTIAQSDAMDAATFTITAKTGGGYSIKSASGLFIGNDADANSLRSSSTDIYNNSISISNGTADIVSSSSHLRYNPTDGQTRFRYYKSGTYTNQQAIQLYKKTEAPTTYIITLAAVANGTISADMEEATEGTTITLTATPAAGYEFSLWTVTDSNNNVIAVTNNQFEMPASNVTVSASFEYVGMFEQKYHLVTSTDQLVAGRTYLIVNTAAGKAMSATSSNGNNRTSAIVSINENIIANLNSAYELTLGGSTGAWTFFDAQWGTSGGYLYAGGGTTNNNYLKTQATLPDEGKWIINIDNNGDATIKTSVSTVVRNTIMYNNSGSGIFSCYASGQQSVQLYIRSEEYPHPQDETIANLLPFDKHVIASGATLTVTGTASCNDPTLLVIEEGGQLIHHTDGLKATLKKTIQAYSDGESDGWYTIAAPFSNFTPTEIATGTYDLYYYDEDASEEWINYKSHQAGFAQPSTSGYLYAHSPSTTLRMTGTLKSGNYSETVNLSYGNSNTSIKGYNLLGNPTAHVINFTKSANVSDGYYYLNNSETWEYVLGNTVPVGRGFLVKANAEGQTVTLNTAAKRGDSYETIRIAVDGDLAYVKLTDGVSMPLLSFRGHQPSLWLYHEGRLYIMLVRNQAEAIDLCYQPNNGHHTLSVDAKGLDLGYLHLIDHLTGADIDLLQNPNYRFESSSSDYKARFQLVFSPNAAESNDNFAFIDADGNLIVTGDGLLQVYDVLGHQLFSSDVHSAFRIPHSAFPPGVYVLRLTTPERVRIQKIIIN